MTKTLFINLFGGPGSGKSTLASALFARLKSQDINCALITEFATEKVWEESTSILNDQIYVFGNQHHKQFVLDKKVDIAITDSPTILSIIYVPDNMDYFVYKPFYTLVMDSFKLTWNMNIFMIRPESFSKVGRIYTHYEAVEIDDDIKKLLNDSRIPFDTYRPNEVREIVDNIISRRYNV